MDEWARVKPNWLNSVLHKFLEAEIKFHLGIKKVMEVVHDSEIRECIKIKIVTSVFSD